MSLRKILKYVERKTATSSFEGEIVHYPSEVEKWTLKLLKNRIETAYPLCEINNRTQNFIYRTETRRTIDGDLQNDYLVKINLSYEFKEDFMKKYPEGLI